MTFEVLHRERDGGRKEWDEERATESGSARTYLELIDHKINKCVDGFGLCVAFCNSIFLVLDVILRCDIKQTVSMGNVQLQHGRLSNADVI